VTDERERPSTAADRRSRQSTGASTPELDGRKGRPTPSRDGRDERIGLFARLARFLREVVAELRKVIWPNRSDLVGYTVVVLVFVSFMVALVAVLDAIFAKGIFAVFGNG
jgi:preprotein translocase subunit SecE